MGRVTNRRTQGLVSCLDGSAGGIDMAVCTGDVQLTALGEEEPFPVFIGRQGCSVIRDDHVGLLAFRHGMDIGRDQDDRQGLPNPGCRAPSW